LKNRIFKITFACLFNFAIFLSLANSGEIEPKTKEILDTIIAGYRANRARIKDLAMTGTSQTTVSQGENVTEFKKLNFEYFQLGDKKRVDYKFTKESDVGEFAKTKEIRWAFTGKSSLCYITGNQFASVGDSTAFHMMSPLTILDTPFITRAYNDFASQIEFYLGRWDPMKEEIQVINIKHEGRALLKVTYSSNRGGRNVIEWIVDPLKGFKRLSEKWENYNTKDDSQFHKTDASYSVIEIAPNIWQTIGCNMSTHRGEKGKNRIVTQIIQPLSYIANTGKVTDSLFTLEGLEVTPGMIVADNTFDPPQTYILGAPPITGKSLPDMKDLGINILPSDVNDKSMLICFFDMEQRPSRNCILQLSKRAQEQSAKDVVIIAVQASKIERAKLDEWIKENNITSSVGIVTGDQEQTRSTWGVKSLPWLILTDKKHVVIAEGFSINELD
jgi:hypothetical protein